MADQVQDEEENKKDYLETLNDLKTLVELDTETYYLRFDMCHYGLELLGYFKPKSSIRDITPDFIKNLFVKHNVRGSVSEHNLQKFCKEANKGKNVSDIILVRGIKPVKGEDEKLSFFVKVKSKRSHRPGAPGDEVEVGAIPTNTFFENVRVGMKLAERVPSTEGMTGVAVDGSVIPAMHGHSLAHSPKAGKGVIYDKKQHVYYATVAGCAIYDEDTGILSVENKLIINDDIDFIIGHIDFIGDLEIFGDVLDDLKVSAGGSILIHGHVARSVLEGRGDIEINGMTGKGEGHVKCGGVFKARYLNGVNVEALGDVIIVNEILNSKIQTTGAIKCPAAHIIGGDYLALKGVEAREIGSEVNVSTRLTVGRSHIILKRINMLQSEMIRIIKRLKKVTKKIKPFKNNKQLVERLEAREKMETLDMLKEEVALINLKERIEHLMNEANEKLVEDANPLISVTGGIKEGVKVSFGITIETIRYEVTKPTTIIEDVVTGRIKMVKYVPVTTDISTLRRRKKKRKS
jgi:uncharacterized protein (DUF342 family)